MDHHIRYSITHFCYRGRSIRDGFVYISEDSVHEEELPCESGRIIGRIESSIDIFVDFPILDWGSSKYFCRCCSATSCIHRSSSSASSTTWTTDDSWSDDYWRSWWRWWRWYEWIIHGDIHDSGTTIRTSVICPIREGISADIPDIWSIGEYS